MTPPRIIRSTSPIATIAWTTGTAFGTAQVQTGQRIRVDGNNGTVTPIS